MFFIIYCHPAIPYKPVIILHSSSMLSVASPGGGSGITSASGNASSSSSLPYIQHTHNIHFMYQITLENEKFFELKVGDIGMV